MGRLITKPSEVREKLARGEELTGHEQKILDRDDSLQARRAKGASKAAEHEARAEALKAQQGEQRAQQSQERNDKLEAIRAKDAARTAEHQAKMAELRERKAAIREQERDQKASASQASQQPRRRIDWRKIGSFRVLFAATLPALIVAGLLGLIWEPLSYVAIPVFLAAWLAAVTNSEVVLYCPFCSKRVKAGASVCHHCGRDVAPGAPAA